jgi:hypothetical protein
MEMEWCKKEIIGVKTANEGWAQKQILDNGTVDIKNR